MENSTSGNDNKIETGEKNDGEILKEEIKRKATLLFLQGKRSIYIRDYQAALVALSESCQLFSQIYPEQDDALADPYFYYGKALLEVGRSESDVLGDQVAEDDGDDEDDDDEDVDEEAEKVESNGDKNDVSTKVENGSNSQAEESNSGEKVEEKTEGEKDNENPGDDVGEVNDLQLSWEYLELAKLIYLKKADTCKNTAIKLAETYLCLGENGLESENYSTAIDDINQALELQKKHLQPEDRRLAETYYQLGIAHSLDQNYNEAIKCFNKAIEQLEKKISSLEMRKKMGDSKTEDEEKDAFYTMDGEISEIRTVIKDVEEKIKDMMESKSKVKAELLKQVYGSEQPSSSSADTSQAGSSSSAPATDISHLIKRKRKTEDAPEGDEKKLKTEIYEWNKLIKSAPAPESNNLPKPKIMDAGQPSPVVQKKQTSGETYCGADRGMFKWCQTISDLDVILLITPTIKSASDIKVETTAESILVQIKISKSQWYTLMDDNFNDKIKPNEVIWTFEPGKLSIHIEKVKEKWWDSFLSKEPKINLQEIELTRPVSDLSEEEEMTLQKLWSDQLEKICRVKSES